MKILLDDEEVFSIDEQTQKILEYYISSDVLKDEIKRRLRWSLEEPYKVALDKLKTDYVGLLASNGITNIPIDDNSLIQLIVAQPGYQDRKAREDARMAKLAAQAEAAQAEALSAAQMAADTRAAEIAAAIKAALQLK